MKISDSHGVKLPETKTKPWRNLNIRDVFPHVPKSSVTDYFNLPRHERTKWGVYLKPYALPLENFSTKGEMGWDTWSKRIRKEFPIQGWFREWFLSWDNPLYAFIKRIHMRRIDMKYAIKNFIDPHGKRYRKVWPRHKWLDITDVIRESNFALILDFWYDEVSRGYVNWESSEQHVEFYDWLKKSVEWIDKGRPAASKQYDIELTLASNNKSDEPYDVKYKKVNEIENIIEQTDTRILNKMIEYRGFFWT